MNGILSNHHSITPNYIYKSLDTKIGINSDIRNLMWNTVAGSHGGTVVGM